MRIKILLPLFLFLLLILNSCSSTIPPVKKVSIYKNYYKLTDDLAYSSLTDLEIRIPAGWFTAEDTICKCIDIWLIRDDFSATINFIPMNIDTIVAENFKENISKLVDLSKLARKNNLTDFKQEKPDEYFEIYNSSFAAYEYIGDEGLPVRVVLFLYKNKVYELSAMPATEVGRGKVNPDELFTIQNSILASMEF